MFFGPSLGFSSQNSTKFVVRRRESDDDKKGRSSCRDRVAERWRSRRHRQDNNTVTTRWTRRGAVAEDINGHAWHIAADRELCVGAVVFVGRAAGRLFRR